MATHRTTRLVPSFPGTPQVNPSWAFQAKCRMHRDGWQPLGQACGHGIDTTRSGGQG